MAEHFGRRSAGRLFQLARYISDVPRDAMTAPAALAIPVSRAPRQPRQCADARHFADGGRPMRQPSSPEAAAFAAAAHEAFTDNARCVSKACRRMRR